MTYFPGPQGEKPKELPKGTTTVLKSSSVGLSLPSSLIKHLLEQKENNMTSEYPILKFFDYSHLPEHLQTISTPFYDLAHQLADTLPCNAETSMALRKLLEAKDCSVRAVL